jgi:hypothetical protein
VSRLFSIGYHKVAIFAACGRAFAVPMLLHSRNQKGNINASRLRVSFFPRHYLAMYRTFLIHHGVQKIRDIAATPLGRFSSTPSIHNQVGGQLRTPLYVISG